MKILVTGATGFVGRHLCRRLAGDANHAVFAAVRQHDDELPESIRQIEIGSIDGETQWIDALDGIDVVVHSAALAHVMGRTSPQYLETFRTVNTIGTRRLAEQAAGASVRRFIFLSSIKVLGERTAPGAPFTAADTPAPEDAYAVSKHEAELALRQICSDGGMQLAVVRPPLVYGPGVKANFLSLFRLIDTGLPLPFARMNNNRRSLVSVHNLVDFLSTLINLEDPGESPFLISDGEDLSTAELARMIGDAMNKRVRLWPVPVSLLALAARLLGKQGMIERLSGSLEVDISVTTRVTGWQPADCVEDTLAEIAQSLR